MSTRLALACSLVLLGACADELELGSARSTVMPEGGLEPSKEEDALDQYTRDLEGQWVATSSDQATTLTIDFMRSNERLRGGIVHWQLQVDCRLAVAANFVAPPECLPPDRETDPPRYPEPATWETEYWMLKLDGTDGVVLMLPKRAGTEGVAFTCAYVPKPAPAQLRCGLMVLGIPFASTTFMRPPR